jgi:bacterioferritin
MQGSPDVIRTLQAAMAAEGHLNLQYRFDWRAVRFMGGKKIAKVLKRYGHDTHCFLRKVTDRLLFLDGDVGYELAAVQKFGTLTEVLKTELALELAIVKPYEEAVQIAMKALDDTTRNLFEHLLKWHEQHVAWLEQQLALIEGFQENTGEARYLAEKL